MHSGVLSMRIQFSLWAFNRDITIAELALDDDFNENRFVDSLIVRYDRVQSLISYSAFRDKYVNQIIPACKSLTSLSCNPDAVDWAVLDPSFLINLRRLNLDDSSSYLGKGMSTEGFEQNRLVLSLIHSHCRSLEDFRCPVIVSLPEVGSLLLDILCINSKIKKLHIVADANILEGLLSVSLSNLTSLTVEHVDGNSESVATLLRCFTQLEFLDFRPRDAQNRNCLNFCYAKANNRLILHTDEKLCGWESLLPVLPKIDILALTVTFTPLDDTRLVDLFHAVGSSLSSLTLIRHTPGTTASSVAALLCMCSNLQSLIIASNKPVQWSEVFGAPNTFRSIEIRGRLAFKDVQQILKVSRGLEAADFQLGFPSDNEKVELRRLRDEYRNDQNTETKIRIGNV